MCDICIFWSIDMNYKEYYKQSKTMRDMTNMKYRKQNERILRLFGKNPVFKNNYIIFMHHMVQYNCNKVELSCIWLGESIYVSSNQISKILLMELTAIAFNIAEKQKTVLYPTTLFAIMLCSKTCYNVNGHWNIVTRMPYLLIVFFYKSNGVFVSTLM